MVFYKIIELLYNQSSRINCSVKKNIIEKFILVFSSIFISLIIIEVLLRTFGFEAQKYREHGLKEPTTNKYHQILGWEPKEGVYDFPPYSESENYTKLTILKDGSRYSGKSATNVKGDIIVVGGSFGQGWGVNDEETFSYLLQKKLPNFKVKNYSVNGYGSFQSLLMLEEIFKKNKNVKLVIYSYILHHETRNYGNASWIQGLSNSKSLTHVSLPYARLDKNNNLIKYKPTKYFKLPLRKYSVLITKIEKKIMRAKLFSLDIDELKITQKIIHEMKLLAEKNGSKFAFVNFDPPSESMRVLGKNHLITYNKFTKKNKIKLIDCGYELTDEHRVKGDGHPNNKAHTLYADCIYNKARNLL